MSTPVETINPAEIFPHHHSLYIKLCNQAAIAHSPLSPIPEGLAHIYKLSRPLKGWDRPKEVARYEVFDDNLEPESILSYYDLELHAFRRTRRLIGTTATEATIPLEINDDPHRLFTDVKAKAAINVRDDKSRRKRTPADHDNLQVNISGVCTRGSAENEDRFSIITTLITHLSQTEIGQSPTPTIPGARLITLFQLYDALDYIDTHPTP